MIFKEFYKNVQSSTVKQLVEDWTYFYGFRISQGSDGSVFINDMQTEFLSIQEAKDFIDSQQIQSQIVEELHLDASNRRLSNKIAGVIKEHYDVKVTDTLVDSYIELVKSKIFTADPVACEIKKNFTFGNLVEGRYDYKLDDGNVVIITEKTQTKINNIFGSYPEIINHMRSSVNNFLTVIAQLED